MVPAPGALPGELRFQPKFDGYRALAFTLWSAPGPLLVQSRRGSLMQSRFPELVDAAADLPDGLVLDGELVVWVEGRIRSRRSSGEWFPAAGPPRGSLRRCRRTSSPSTSSRSTARSCCKSRTASGARS
jgi:hypothetical protein